MADWGVDADVALTEWPGHARVLTQEALARGAATIIAWGGDGTINEVAAVLAFTSASLGIIPSGSGNGLARALGIPFDPAQAFDVALNGRRRCIDAGELDGRLFFNVAGIGLDARVAHEFAAHGLVRRGFRRYLEVAVRELFQFRADEHTVVADGTRLRTRAMLIALANGRQYGNGALIAPLARLDDGYLDVVVVAARSPLVAILQAPFLFAGWIARLPGVTTLPARDVEVTSARAVLYHVDGEPFIGGASVKACVHPEALRVIAP